MISFLVKIIITNYILQSAASAFANKFTTIKQSMTSTAPSGSSMSLASSIGGQSTTSSTLTEAPDDKKCKYFELCVL